MSFAVVLAAVACGLIVAGIWIGALAGLAAVVGAGAAVWPLIAARPKELPPPDQRVPDWVIERPTEMARAIAALTSARAGTVGITTALQGAGGFGKTTLAKMVCADRRVRRHFGGRVHWVTVGRDLRAAAAAAAKVNDVIRLVTASTLPSPTGSLLADDLASCYMPVRPGCWFWTTSGALAVEAVQ